MFAGFNLQGVTEESFDEFYEYGENYLRAQRRFVEKNWKNIFVKTLK